MIKNQRNKLTASVSHQETRASEGSNNMRFILSLIRMKLSRMMVFRLSFFGAFFVDSSLFAIQLLMFSAIYSQVDTLGGFTRGEMLLFVGTFSLINALNMIIFFFGTISISDKIKSGELDHYITKPVNPLLRLTFENVDPGSIPLAIASILLILYGVQQTKAEVTPGHFVLYFFYVLMMTLLWYDILLITRTIPFFTISASGIERISDTLLELCMNIPGTLFQGITKVIFYLILPYGIMATLPTELLAGKLTLQGFLYGCAVVCFFTVFALWFWRFGLKHYQSASS